MSHSDSHTKPDQYHGYHLFPILTALWSFAVVQPLLDLIGKQPQFLVVHDIAGFKLLLLLILLFLIPPCLLWIVINLLRRVHGGLATIMTGLVSGILLAAAFRPMLGTLISGAGAWQIVASLTLGIALAWFISRWPRLLAQSAMLSFVPLIFTLVFVFQPGIRPLIFGGAGMAEHDKIWDPTVAPPAPIPVVMVVLDAFPTVSIMDAAGEIDASLCPNLAAFAADAVWYRNTLTIGDDTLWAVPAIMTGNRPQPGSQPTFAWHPSNIFTWLAATHTVRAFESHTKLAPPAARDAQTEDTSFWGPITLTVSDLWLIYLHVLVPTDLAGDLPSVTHDWRGFAVEQATSNGQPRTMRDKLVESFLAALGEGSDDRSGEGDSDGEAGSCFFLHAVFPHTPYQYTPTGHWYSMSGKERSGQGMQWGTFRDDRWTTLLSQQRHLLQVGYTDRLIGRVVARLREAGLYDEAIVVVTADHGASFRPGDERRGISTTNAGDIMAVPLFIKYPGTGQGAVDDRCVSTLDILPTVATALGTSLPWPDDGTSLLDSSYTGIETAMCVGRTDTATLKATKVVGIRDASVRQKVMDFGARAGDSALFAPVRGASLLGTSVPLDLPVDPDIRIHLEREGPWICPDPTNGIWPLEVDGTVLNPEPLGSDLDLAVAVDGVIRSVFRPYGRKEGSPYGYFAAMLPGECMPAGEHEIEILLVDWVTGDPALRSLGMERMSRCGINLVVSDLPGLESWGMYGVSDWNGTPGRWTDGAAGFQLSGLSGEVIEAARLAIVGNALPESEVIVVCNGALVLDTLVTREGWSGVMDLRQVEVAQNIRLGVFSSTLVPADVSSSDDRRRLGVVLQTLELLSQYSTVALPDAAAAQSDAAAAQSDFPSVTPLIIRPGQDDLAEFSGFRHTSRWDGDLASWTDGRGRITAAWAASTMPRYLHLDLADVGPAGTHLTVIVNDVTVQDGKVKRGRFLGLMDLHEVARSDSLTITVESGTFVPHQNENSDDPPARLGVAFRSLTLIP